MQRTLETLDDLAETLAAMTDQQVIHHGPITTTVGLIADMPTAVVWHENHGHGIMMQ